MVLKASGSRAYAGLALTLQGAVAPRVLPKVGQSSSPSLPETPPSFLCPSSTSQVFGVWSLRARLSRLSVPSTPWQLLLCRQKAVPWPGDLRTGSTGTRCLPEWAGRGQLPRPPVSLCASRSGQEGWCRADTSPARAAPLSLQARC